MKIDPQIRAELAEYVEKLNEKNKKKSIKTYLKKKLQEKKTKIVVISSYKMTEEEINNLLKQLPFIKDPYSKIENKVDHNLLAGVIVKFGSKVIDLTLDGKLNSLKKSLYTYEYS